VYTHLSRLLVLGLAIFIVYSCGSDDGKTSERVQLEDQFIKKYAGAVKWDDFYPDWPEYTIDIQAAMSRYHDSLVLLNAHLEDIRRSDTGYMGLFSRFFYDVYFELSCDQDQVSYMIGSAKGRRFFHIAVRLSDFVRPRFQTDFWVDEEDPYQGGIYLDAESVTLFRGHLVDIVHSARN